jgi:hypothetical protein
MRFDEGAASVCWRRPIATRFSSRKGQNSQLIVDLDPPLFRTAKNVHFVRPNLSCFAGGYFCRFRR